MLVVCSCGAVMHLAVFPVGALQPGAVSIACNFVAIPRRFETVATTFSTADSGDHLEFTRRQCALQSDGSNTRQFIGGGVIAIRWNLPHPHPRRTDMRSNQSREPFHKAY